MGDEVRVLKHYTGSMFRRGRKDPSVANHHGLVVGHSEEYVTLAMYNGFRYHINHEKKQSIVTHWGNLNVKVTRRTSDRFPHLIDFCRDVLSGAYLDWWPEAEEGDFRKGGQVWLNGSWVRAQQLGRH